MVAYLAEKVNRAFGIECCGSLCHSRLARLNGQLLGLNFGAKAIVGLGHVKVVRPELVGLVGRVLACGLALPPCDALLAVG